MENKESNFIAIKIIIQIYFQVQSTVLLLQFAHEKYMLLVPTAIFLGAITGLLSKWLIGILLKKFFEVKND